MTAVAEMSGRVTAVAKMSGRVTAVVEMSVRMTAVAEMSGRVSDIVLPFAPKKVELCPNSVPEIKRGIHSYQRTPSSDGHHSCIVLLSSAHQKGLIAQLLNLYTFI